MDQYFWGELGKPIVELTNEELSEKIDVHRAGVEKQLEDLNDFVIGAQGGAGHSVRRITWILFDEFLLTSLLEEKSRRIENGGWEMNKK
jgi:hypothetical protein